MNANTESRQELDPRRTVANIVGDHPECGEVFRKHGIDFCCGGDEPLEESCQYHGVPLGLLLSELNRAIARTSGGEREEPVPRSLSTPELIHLIISKHHGYLREALPIVEQLAIRVARVHGERNARLEDLREAVRELADLLLPHLDEEEQTLFPMLGAGTLTPDHLAQLIDSTREEHQAVGDLLAEIRFATEEYRTPEWACASYRTLFAELKALEADVMRHVYLENHVLMPRFGG